MESSEESDVSGAFGGGLKRELAVNSAYSTPEFQTVSVAKHQKTCAANLMQTYDKPKTTKSFTAKDLFLTDS